MHVLCTNCEASYDVDAILVPTKGVPLRCARCETVFRVEPEYPVPEGAPEWVLHDRGESRPVMTMGELQRLIRSGEVTRDAELDRIAVGKRRLHEIPELLSFFPEAADSGMQDRTTQKHRVQSSIPPPLTRKSTAPSKGEATGDLILGQARLTSPRISEAPTSTLRPLQLREDIAVVRAPHKQPNLLLFVVAALVLIAIAGVYFWPMRAAVSIATTPTPIAAPARAPAPAEPPARAEVMPVAAPTAVVAEPNAATPIAETHVHAQESAESFDGLVREARAALERGDLRRAEEKVTAADGARPNRPEVTTLRGYIALERGDQQRALRYFRDAGDFGDALVGKAEVERVLHQEGDARTTYHRYLELYPQGPSASLARRQLERLGAFPTATQAPTPAPESAPAPENPASTTPAPEATHDENHAEEPSPYQRLD